MNLSDAQRVLADAMFDDHTKRYEAFRADRISALNARGGEYLAGGRDADMWEALMADRDSLVADMTATDAELFSKLRAMLAETQHDGCDRTALRRTRSIAIEIKSLRPGVNIDLTALVAELQAKDLVRITDEAVFDEESALYEREVTPLMRMRVDAQMQVRREDERLFGELHRHAPESDEFARVQRRQDANYRDLYRLDRRIHDINVAYLERLAAVLDESGAVVMRRLFRVKAYPNIFPNPFECEPLLTHLIGTCESKEHSEQLAMALQSWKESESQLTRAMVDAHLDWMEALMRNRAVEQPAYHRYEQRLTELQRERRLASQRAIETMRAMPPNTLSQQARVELAQLEQAVAQHQPRRNGVLYFP